jgi:ATP-dependent DNA ligase
LDVLYYLFDLLAYDGFDLTGLPLRDRKRVLRAIFDYRDPLRYSVHRNTEGEAYYRYPCERGCEGLIAKRADSRYRSGRSTDWLKFKCVREQEFVVGGFTDPQRSRVGLGAVLVGYYQQGKLRYAGKVGAGYDNATLRALRTRLEALTQPQSPGSPTPCGSGARTGPARNWWYRSASANGPGKAAFAILATSDCVRTSHPPKSSWNPASGPSG